MIKTFYGSVDPYNMAVPRLIPDILPPTSHRRTFSILDLGRVKTSNFSLPNLAPQRMICRFELNHVTKSHWQKSMGKMIKLS